VLVLAPRGRDAAIVAAMLGEADMTAEPCASLPHVLDELDVGAGIVVLTEEALATTDLNPLAAWIAAQPEWSDLPFVLLTGKGGGIERNPAARRYLDVLGNVSFLERPFHPTTLVSLTRAALRGRSRQYEARARLEALRAGEQRLQFALEAGGMGAWELDLRDLVLTASDHCRANFGFAPGSAFSYADLREVIHPDDRDRQDAAVHDAVVGCRDYDIEYRVRWPATGETRWVAIRGRPTYATDGSPSRMAGVSFDITDRKLAEDALRHSVARLRFLGDLDEGMRAESDAPAAMLTAATLLAGRLGASRCAYADVDADNDRFVIRNDYTASGIASSAGSYSLDLFGPRAAADMRGGQTLVVRDVAGELAPGEGRETFLAIGIGAIVCCPLVRNGRLAAMMAVHQDAARNWLADEVTLVRTVVERCWSHVERVGAEARLRESEERLRLATEHADIGFWDVDPIHDRLVWPPTVKAMFGIAPDVDVSMRDFYDGLHPDDREATGAAYAAAADPALRALYDVEYRTVGKEDGVVRWVAAKGRGIFVGDRCVRLLGTAVDVTARKGIEERIRDLNETLERRVIDEVAERTKAEDALRQAQKMEAVGQLTGGVAHDFNNLLTIIKSSTDLLRKPNLAEERRRRYVDAISDTVDRAAKLTGQLLAFARRQPLKPEVFEPPARVRAITEMLGSIVGSRIEIVTDIRAEDCFVEADVSQFETALVNMAVNARDAMDGEGRLTIIVEDMPQIPPIRGHAGGTGAFVAISLADTGSGIAPDKLLQIFEPFYTTKEVGKGTGLGLSQVFGFAKQSGGDIDVQSKQGRGSRFTLYLPRVERDPAVHGDAEPSRPAAVVGGGGGQRVLVVEDNVDVGTFSTQLLRDLGYEPMWAANGNEALRLLSEGERFDAVFSDVVMPGMGGVELGLEIRKRHPGLPIVLTSGYSHVLAEEGRHGFELLLKPYAVEDLSRILRLAIRGQPSRGGDAS
jgi:PAS domain S-box-containing protein